MTPGAFEQKYIYRSKHLRRLRISQETRCFFLKDGGCSIHEVKPTQCRVFPYWPELLESKSEWKKRAAFCPGIGKGPLIQSRWRKRKPRRCGKHIRSSTEHPIKIVDIRFYLSE